MEEEAGPQPAYEQGMAGPPVSNEQMQTIYAAGGCRPSGHLQSDTSSSPTNSFRKLIDVPMPSYGSGLIIVAFRQNNLRHSRIGRSNPIHMEIPMDLATLASPAVEASVLKAAMAGTMRLQRRGSLCLAPDSLPRASTRTPKTLFFIWHHFSRIHGSSRPMVDYDHTER